MIQLTRESALQVLGDAGFPSGDFTTNLGVKLPFRVLVVAVAGAESDLVVGAQGPPNRDGSIDRGWLQINSVHGYDSDRLLSDPLYTAQAALQILLQQGVRAWAAYGVRNTEGVYPYARRLPPGLGGPDVARGGKQVREVAKSVQGSLNTQSTTVTKLVVDGAFGPRSEAALVAYCGQKIVNAEIWQRLGLR